MRTLTFLLVTLASVLGISAASQAAIVIDFEIGGSQSVEALGSSSVTVDIYMTATGTTAVSGYQFTVQYHVNDVRDGSGLTNLSVNNLWKQNGPDVYYDAGKVGVGRSDPHTSLHVEGGLLATGVGGDVPIQGAGVRFMWVPSAVAFRVGTVQGDGWDEGRIGWGSSVTGGYNNIAEGRYGFIGGGNSNIIHGSSTARSDHARPASGRRTGG